MKHLLIIKNMQDEKDAEAISEMLQDAGVIFEVDLQHKTLNILNRGDAVQTAKRIISEHGYIVI